MTPIIPIALGEKTFMFHFNNYATIELGRLLNVDPADSPAELLKMMNGNLLDAVVFLITAGIVGYQKAQGNFNHGITLKDIAEPMATANINEFDHVYLAFKEATGLAEFLSTVPSDEKKKK